MAALLLQSGLLAFLAFFLGAWLGFAVRRIVLVSARQRATRIAPLPKIARARATGPRRQVFRQTDHQKDSQPVTPPSVTPGADQPVGATVMVGAIGSSRPSDDIDQAPIASDGDGNGKDKIAANIGAPAADNRPPDLVPSDGPLSDEPPAGDTPAGELPGDDLPEGQAPVDVLPADDIPLPSDVAIEDSKSPAVEAAANAANPIEPDSLQELDSTSPPPDDEPAEPQSAEGGRETSFDDDQPVGLETARGGIEDDLRRIRGVGEKTQTALNAIGIWHFDQIAAWTDDEVAWIAVYLGFPGRVAREDWIGQAGILGAGVDTEYSWAYDRRNAPASPPPDSD